MCSKRVGQHETGTEEPAAGFVGNRQAARLLLCCLQPFGRVAGTGRFERGGGAVVVAVVGPFRGKGVRWSFRYGKTFALRLLGGRGRE